MGDVGDWPRGALPMGPSVYEDAMRPLYQEAVWRERNFYWADDNTPPTPVTAGPGGTPPVQQTTVAPAVNPLAIVTSPIKDFGDFLRPNGQWNWPRVGMIVGGLLVVGILIGHRK